MMAGRRSNIKTVVFLFLVGAVLSDARANVFSPLSESVSIYGYGLFDFCISGGEAKMNVPAECRPGGSFAQFLFAPFIEFKLFERARVLTEIEILYAPELAIFGEIEAKTTEEVGEVEYAEDSVEKVEGLSKVEYKRLGYEDGVKVEGFGEIDLAFAFFEYEFHKLFTFRAGKYLNPFGLILERRDAQPTYLFLFLPQLYRKQAFTLPDGGTYSEWFVPPYNVGVQLRGEHPWFGYAVQLANGRGAVANVIDVNADKAIGVHLFLRIPTGRFFGTRVGADFYTDSNQFDIRQNTFAGHLGLNVKDIGPGSILLWGEGAFTTISPYGVSAWTGYVLLSYQFPLRGWLVSPFVLYDFLEPNIDIAGDTVEVIRGGLALNPHPNLRLKLEVHFHQDEEGRAGQIFGVGISYAF